MIERSSISENDIKQENGEDKDLNMAFICQINKPNLDHMKIICDQLYEPSNSTLYLKMKTTCIIRMIIIL